MAFNAARGGHAPGHLRHAFLECLNSNGETWYEALVEEDTLIFRDPAPASLRLVAKRQWGEVTMAAAPKPTPATDRQRQLDEIEETSNGMDEIGQERESL